MAFENPWDDSFPEEIESVTIRGHVRRPLWYAPRAGRYAEWDAARIQDVIGTKDVKLGRYRLRCTSAWLVIVVDGFAPSSFVDLERQAAGHTYATSFDRVYIFENFDHLIVKLHPKA